MQSSIVPKEHCQGKQPVLAVKICQLREGKGDKQQLLIFEMSGEISTGGRRFTKLLPRLQARRCPSAAASLIWAGISLSPAVGLLSQTPPGFLVQKPVVINGNISSQNSYIAVPSPNVTVFKDWAYTDVMKGK